MDRIDQIYSQNRQDALSILYKNLAKAVLYAWGKDGEVVLRKAIHYYGETVGKAEKDMQQQAGILTNLENFFKSPMARVIDPRFRFEWQFLGEQEAVFDVTVCPIYNYLAKTGAEKLMLPFCEEYHHGCIVGYTDDNGQCNFAENFHFSGEGTCRFGCYFRPGNVPAADREKSFSGYTFEYCDGLDKYIPCDDSAKVYSNLGLMMIKAFIEKAVERYGDHHTLGVIATGIRMAAVETARYFEYRSDATNLGPNGMAFADINSLWGTECTPFDSDDEELKKLVSINYCTVLKNEYKGK